MCLKVTGNDDYLLQALKTARTVVAPPSWVWAIRLFLWRNGGGQEPYLMQFIAHFVS